jgi:low temperature requirement protein LtrA
MIYKGILIMLGLILMSIGIFLGIKAYKNHKTAMHPCSVSWNPLKWFISNAEWKIWWDDEGLRLLLISRICVGSSGVLLIIIALFF